MKILFLDIDGVLNGHEWKPLSQSNTIRRSCIYQLNRVIRETDCKIVLSSSWRYMIHGGAMTKTGFEYLLKSHGAIGARIEDTTCRDCDIQIRGDQVAAWLRTHPVESFACVDDDWYGGPTFVRRRMVQTDGGRGLKGDDADKLIRLLSRKWIRPKEWNCSDSRRQ